MIRSLLFFICFVVSGYIAGAQSYFYDDKYYENDLLFEAGLSFGLMNGVGDVGARLKSQFSPAYYDLKSVKISYGVHGAVMYKGLVEGRLELTKGTIAGYDGNSDSKFVRERNLNYNTKIFELTLTGALHPLLLLNTETLPVISPYVLAGVGIFSFYPRTKYLGELIPLRRLNLEGQNSPEYPARKQYPLRAVSMPIGVGLKYEYNAKINLRLEALYRFTSSDYLDDVSTTYVSRSIFPTQMQKNLAHRYLELNPRMDRTGLKRGSATINDRFFTLGFKIGYVIGREKIPINYAPK